MSEQHTGDTELQQCLVSSHDADDGHPFMCAVGTLRSIASYVSDLERRLEKAEAERDGWRGMEIAPMDGTVILVFRSDQGVFTAHYVEEDAHLSNAMNPPEGDCYWFSTSGDDLTNEMPTHWRPLPSFPTPEQG